MKVQVLSWAGGISRSALDCQGALAPLVPSRRVHPKHKIERVE